MLKKEYERFKKEYEGARQLGLCILGITVLIVIFFIVVNLAK